jgi:hypothetical protein
MHKGSVFWLGHVAAIRREGISTSAYAKRQGIAVKRLYYWQRKAAAASTGAIEPNPFVALRIGTPVGAPAPANCTVVLASGVRLEMGNLPSPEWLAALDRATQGAH